VVPRRFLEVLGRQTLPPDLASKTSGRLQLAQWITDRSNSLFARVIVNRIWQHHFSRGLVSTPNDFGSRGSAPSHPELLDFLATRFLEKNYSIKQMHRTIMLSRVYQLMSDEVSADTPRSAIVGDIAKNRVADPDNMLLWKHNRIRLDADALRDTLLYVSGTLDLTPPAGPHPFPPMEKWGFTQHHPFKDVYQTTKRSVYVMTRRLNTLPFFTAFDGADANATTPRRDSSVTTLQALFWLNDPFLHEQAKAFACRICKEESDEVRRVERAFMLTAGRAPSKVESSAIRESITRLREQYKKQNLPADAIETQTWQSFARAMFRLNEFIYID
jgi:hypothetical protein